jgi:hypothetical protein
MRESNIRDKFIRNEIPYDDIDSEMIEILDVLNFNLGIKTKFSCIGHRPQEPTYIMFENLVEDEDMHRLISIVDENVGSCNIKGVKLYKWLRMMYQRYYSKPHYPVSNWILEISGVKDKNERVKRLKTVTEGLKKA